MFIYTIFPSELLCRNLFIRLRYLDPAEQSHLILGSEIQEEMKIISEPVLTSQIPTKATS